jgi:hypothetical protein
MARAFNLHLSLSTTRFLGFVEQARDHDPCKNPEDDDDDHDFNQGEAALTLSEIFAHRFPLVD